MLTTVALGVGFSALLLSDFDSVAVLGAATTITLVVALMGDLFLLPSLLVLGGYARTHSAADSGPAREQAEIVTGDSSRRVA